MKRFTNPLDNMRVASPCAANWDEMLGDERRRFCSACSLNVYNLSGMTRDEAENLLLASEGRVCVRFYRRRDGTILTKDCPVGWQAVKRRMSRAATAFVSLCAGIFAGIFAFNQPRAETSIDPEAMPVQSLPESFTRAAKSFEGDAGFERYSVGQFIISDLPVAGMPVNLDEVRKDIKKKRKR
ncbi:MAG TPA: hypothetical protein VK400_17010 [Pyrinomonadaceae bacterium]|nr:hypothetical protein [Pyrinomonadaceae bacterium]